MTVVLTGASGVVGAAVARHLVDAGRAVRGLSRSSAADARLAELGVEAVRGDIMDPVSLRAAFEGAEVVYHIAGLNTMCPEDPGELERVNVGGSVAVVEAVRAAGVDRLVYTSSAATIGEPAGTVGSETTVHRGSYLSHYERSKHLAELAVFEAAGDLDLVSVNPSSVQGPGRATGTGKLILDLLRGKLPALIDTRISLVDIDDTARGHLLAETHGRTGGRYVLNSFTMSMRDAVQLLERVSGRSVSVRWLPGWVASAAIAPVESVAGLFGKKPPFCREMVRTLRHGHAYDGSLASRELGLEYTAAETMITRLVDWFVDEGLL